MRPHRRQPVRLFCPWHSPGKNTGVGCHFLLQCVKVKSESEVALSCPTLSDPMDCSPPGSSVHGIFQARVLGWVAMLIFLAQLCLINISILFCSYFISYYKINHVAKLLSVKLLVAKKFKRKHLMITLYVRQQKRYRCSEQTFGLCGRGRGWDDLGEWH